MNATVINSHALTHKNNESRTSFGLIKKKKKKAEPRPVVCVVVEANSSGERGSERSLRFQEDFVPVTQCGRGSGTPQEDLLRATRTTQHPELYRRGRCLLQLQRRRLSEVVFLHVLDEGIIVIARELHVLGILLHVPAAVGGAVVEERG